MIQRLKLINNLISNMGYRYLLFRVGYMVKSKLGLQRIIFPTNPKFIPFISLNKWRENLPPFFFYGKNIRGLDKKPNEDLCSNFKDIKNGIITFFSKDKIDLGNHYDWITNPFTKYRYDISKHWSKVADLSQEAGDIKFVWEKARFSYLYDVILYDYHHEDDQSEFVFKEIESFINHNPINQGPNYKCSQEISLRILNWIFALYYYKDSPNLTEELFDKILHVIYWQIHHVYHNIHFSRISVRNNHAITETLLLYLSGKLFPFLPNVKKWSQQGKAWFEQEIEYQIYPDGTFLQFSMNYHRVVIQLLTWAIQLSKVNNDSFKSVVYERAEKSLHFLDVCTDPVTGKLPNYGANDGALFFKLTNDNYRVYRSQLDDLRAVLKGFVNYDTKSVFWYGLQPKYEQPKTIPEVNEFENGGYYIMQENDVKTFIRCGSYKDRPGQSDNLHLDLWVKGENILFDTGSFKYNTTRDYIEYFNGSQGHNTLSVDGKNQMLKGGRFIWYYWVKKAVATLIKQEDVIVFKGKINAYKELGNNITHQREVKKNQGVHEWIVKDQVENINGKEIFQYWHLPMCQKDKISIQCYDSDNRIIQPLLEQKWHSPYYGYKEPSLRVTFKTKSNSLCTRIKLAE